jgi:hypothetical protein
MTHHHFSDEQLSAHLDGQENDTTAAGGPPGIDAQIAACDRCRARFTALEEVRHRLRRGVVRVDGPAKAAAVAAALADGLDGGLDGRHDRGGQAAPWSSPSPDRHQRRLVGAAAAAAVVVVAVGISLAASHSQGSEPTAASSTATTHASEKSTPGASAASPQAAATSGLPDLGRVASPTALKARLVPALAGKYGTATGAPNQDNQSVQGESATGATTSNGVSVPEADSACVAVAEQVVGYFGSPTLVATVTYLGIPALAVVSPTAGSDTASAAGQNVVVITASSCRVLIRTTL